MRILLLLCGLLFVTPERALAQPSTAATIRIDGAITGVWSGNASIEFQLPTLLVLWIRNTSETKCCLAIQMRRSGRSPLRPGSYRVVVGPAHNPREDTTVFQTFLQLPGSDFGFIPDTATGTVVIEAADALSARGRVAFKLFRRGRPLLAPGKDTLRIESTFSAVNHQETYRRALSSIPETAEDNPPEAVLGVTLGGDRRLLNRYLSARGWTQAVDSIEADGYPSVHKGAIDGRRAEVVALFGFYRPDRLINLFVAFPAKTPEEMRDTYLWAYRFMERRRCAAVISAEDKEAISRITAGTKVAFLPLGHGLGQPIAPGHAVIDLGNLLWPRPTWDAADGLSGVQLYASILPKDAAWPYQVTLWSGKIFAGQGTRCDAPR